MASRSPHPGLAELMGSLAPTRPHQGVRTSQVVMRQRSSHPLVRTAIPNMIF